MPGETFVWKADGQVTEGALDFGELLLDPEVRTPEHIHHGNDEIYYVVDGRIRFKVGNEFFDATTGSFVFIPRGMPHAWVNNSGGETRLMLLFTPGGAAGLFDELKPLIPKLMVGVEDMSKVDSQTRQVADEIMRRYQYELVGPPLT
jgi:quercetin dioxygenase-like cupin family protein